MQQEEEEGGRTPVEHAAAAAALKRNADAPKAIGGVYDGAQDIGEGQLAVCSAAELRQAAWGAGCRELQ